MFFFSFLFLPFLSFPDAWTITVMLAPSPRASTDNTRSILFIDLFFSHPALLAPTRRALLPAPRPCVPDPKNGSLDRLLFVIPFARYVVALLLLLLNFLLLDRNVGWSIPVRLEGTRRDGWMGLFSIRIPGLDGGGGVFFWAILFRFLPLSYLYLGLAWLGFGHFRN